MIFDSNWLCPLCGHDLDCHDLASDDISPYLICLQPRLTAAVMLQNFQAGRPFAWALTS